MSNWFITIQALRKYASDSRAAQHLLDEANNEMRQAAQALYEASSGDWADAFKDEQSKLEGWLSKIINIGSEYIETCLAIADKYEEAENAIKSQIGRG